MAVGGYSPVGQSDFSAGEFRSIAPQLIPSNGAFSLRNVLLDEDGSAYRRGGSVYRSTTGHGSSGLTFLWRGYLGSALTTVIASPSEFATVSEAGAVTSIGGAGLTAPAPAVQLGGKLIVGGGATWDGSALGVAARTAPVYVVAGGKLVSLEGNRAYESAFNDPTTFAALDFQELPSSARTISGAGLGDRLLWATTDGVWMVSGLPLDLTDDLGGSQQRVERVYPEIIGWGACGVAYWQGGVVLPALDGLWLVDGVSAPRMLSRSISDLWREYVNDGYLPGLATVHRNHYFLPILQGASFVKLLVCRLDRPVRSPVGEVFPWTHFEESGAALSALVSGPDNLLLGAEALPSSRVVRLPYFDPTSAVKADANGVAHSWRVVTRDMATGGGRKNTVAGVEVRYELTDAQNDNPYVSASYGTGARASTLVTWGSTAWGASTWSSGGDDTMTPMSGYALEDPLGGTPFTWRDPVRTRFIRIRLEGQGASARAVLRSLRLLVRESGRQS